MNMNTTAKSKTIKFNSEDLDKLGITASDILNKARIIDQLSPTCIANGYPLLILLQSSMDIEKRKKKNKTTEYHPILDHSYLAKPFPCKYPTINIVVVKNATNEKDKKWTSFGSWPSRTSRIL